jgi:hypothetical protein
MAPHEQVADNTTCTIMSPMYRESLQGSQAVGMVKGRLGHREVRALAPPTSSVDSKALGEGNIPRWLKNLGRADGRIG